MSISIIEVQVLNNCSVIKHYSEKVSIQLNQLMWILSVHYSEDVTKKLSIYQKSTVFLISTHETCPSIICIVITSTFFKCFLQAPWQKVMLQLPQQSCSSLSQGIAALAMLWYYIIHNSRNNPVLLKGCVAKKHGCSLWDLLRPLQLCWGSRSLDEADAAWHFDLVPCTSHDG